MVWHLSSVHARANAFAAALAADEKNSKEAEKRGEPKQST